jgi:hypothetical protein
MLAVFIRALIPASALPVTKAWALAAKGKYTDPVGVTLGKGFLDTVDDYPASQCR